VKTNINKAYYDSNSIAFNRGTNHFLIMRNLLSSIKNCNLLSWLNKIENIVNFKFSRWNTLKIWEVRDEEIWNKTNHTEVVSWSTYKSRISKRCLSMTTKDRLRRCTIFYKDNPFVKNSKDAIFQLTFWREANLVIPVFNVAKHFNTLLTGFVSNSKNTF